MNYFLEACCTSVEDVLLAIGGGASRIELCSDLSCGGVTPSQELLKEVLRIATVPVNVMIRPVARESFTVTQEEAELMISQIAACRELGASGIVAGALLPDGIIDLDLIKRIVAAAAPLPVTFHKAFDACAKPLEALESLISAGCKRLLTSGCAPTAMEGLPLLAELVSAASGRIIIMPGGSIRPSNISRIANATHAAEFHASAAYYTESFI